MEDLVHNYLNLDMNPIEKSENDADLANAMIEGFLEKSKLNNAEKM